MKSHTKPLRRAFMENQLRTTQVRGHKTSAEKEENIIEWMTFF